MKYTNNKNYPIWIEQWLKNDTYDYDKNTISATTLLIPARIYALKILNEDKLNSELYKNPLQQTIDQWKVINWKKKIFNLLKKLQSIKK